MNTTQLRKDLGDQLREARNAKGMSQRMLAANAGIREQTLVDLEKGRNAELNTLFIVLQNLGLSLVVCGERF